MKKNMFMRLAMALVLLVLVTTSAVGGTYAKYVSGNTAEDNARVAKWGFEPVELDFTNLFKTTYTIGTDGEAESANTDDIIAPGTTGNASFSFMYDLVNPSGIEAPEVKYTFKVSTAGSNCAPEIQKNNNIVWTLTCLENGTSTTILNEVTWTALIDYLELMDEAPGDAAGEYAAGILPDLFDNNEVYTITWTWKFAGGTTEYDHDNDPSTPKLKQDQYDTYLANKDVLDTLKLKITISAEQLQ